MLSIKETYKLRVNKPKQLHSSSRHLQCLKSCCANKCNKAVCVPVCACYKGAVEDFKKIEVIKRAEQF